MRKDGAALIHGPLSAVPTDLVRTTKKAELSVKTILEINGEHYFYVDGERGESNGADHIWRAKSGNQLAFLGPDYDYAELTTPAVN